MLLNKQITNYFNRKLLSFSKQKIKQASLNGLFLSLKTKYRFWQLFQYQNAEKYLFSITLLFDSINHKSQ